MTGFFAFITLIFIAVAYYLPEWVGITGKKALEIEKHQHSEITANPPAMKGSELFDADTGVSMGSNPNTTQKENT